MSENAALKINLQANADQLNAAIAKATAKIDELGAKIKSLPSGDKEFNKLSRELARTSITQQTLIKSFDKLGTESETTAPKIEKTADASKSARTALASLSLTLQDLPFGFIGVQNNLPAVIQSFGNLTTTTNGKVLPALKEIGKSLVGPAGLFLAFSVVTSIVTSLVQEYGSLRGAIDALLGVQKSLNAQIREFNKEYDDFIKKQQTVSRITQDAKASQEGQIAVVNSLAKKSTDLTLSQKEQKNALEELKRVDKDYFGNLVFGVSTVEDIRKAVQKYNTVLIARSKIEAYKDEISSTQSLIEENKRLKIAQDSVVESDKKRSFQGQVSVGIGNETVANIFSQILAIRSNKKEQDNLSNSSKSLENRVLQLKKLIDDQNSIIAANTSEFIKAEEAVKQYFESYKPSKEYLDFFKFYDDKSRFERAQNLFDKLKEIDPSKGVNSVKKFNEILQQLQDDFPNYFEGISISAASEIPSTFLKIRDLLFNALDTLSSDIVQETLTGNISKAGARVVEAYFGNTQQIRDALKKAKEEAKKAIGQYQPLDASNVFGKGPASYEQAMSKVIEAQKTMKDEQKKMVNNIRDTSNLLGDVFFDPLQEQFRNLIENGKFTFKEFSKIVLENLKALTAKIIATGILQLIGTIVTGGFGAASFAKTGLTGFQLFGKAFASALGFGGVTGANFGGLNPGGLAMSGAVSLSLRGSDLVGAINRTNTNINRIG